MARITNASAMTILATIQRQQFATIVVAGRKYRLKVVAGLMLQRQHVLTDTRHIRGIIRQMRLEQAAETESCNLFGKSQKI